MTLLDELEAQLKQAVFDINEEWRQMGVADLKDRLRKVVGIHTLTVQPGSVVINNQTIPIGAAATDDEIAAAIQANITKINGIISTTTTTVTRPMSITGAHTLSASIKDKIQAAKDRMAQSSAKTDNALKKFHNAVDVADNVSQSIETEADDLMKELGQFTNGGPA